jgi:hypothetical protein
MKHFCRDQTNHASDFTQMRSGLNFLRISAFCLNAISLAQQIEATTLCAETRQNTHYDLVALDKQNSPPKLFTTGLEVTASFPGCTQLSLKKQDSTENSAGSAYVTHQPIACVPAAYRFTYRIDLDHSSASERSTGILDLRACTQKYPALILDCNGQINRRTAARCPFFFLSRKTRMVAPFNAPISFCDIMHVPRMLTYTMLANRIKRLIVAPNVRFENIDWLEHAKDCQTAVALPRTTPYTTWKLLLCQKPVKTFSDNSEFSPSGCYCPCETTFKMGDRTYRPERLSADRTKIERFATVKGFGFGFMYNPRFIELRPSFGEFAWSCMQKRTRSHIATTLGLPLLPP